MRLVVELGAEAKGPLLVLCDTALPESRIRLTYRQNWTRYRKIRMLALVGVVGASVRRHRHSSTFERYVPFGARFIALFFWDRLD